MLIYYDPVFLEHDTGRHPECAARLIPVARRVHAWALDAGCQQCSWQPATLEDLARCHTAEYVESVRDFAESGGGYIEMDTAVSERSFEVARVAAGAVCDAVTRVVQGDARHAFCLVRPPGHHALSNAAMGFCLFNNVAVGSRLAIAGLGLERVLIVDWDVHHGNGTQAIFWEDPQVGYFSIHRWPFYPGTGSAEEIGARMGRGATLNVPIAFGTTRKEYLARFSNALQAFAAKIRPQLVLISAGFDSHRADPIGSLGLESEDFQPLTRLVLEIADAYADGKVVSILEGGYNPAALSECVAVHLDEMLAHHENGSH